MPPTPKQYERTLEALNQCITRLSMAGNALASHPYSFDGGEQIERLLEDIMHLEEKAIKIHNSIRGGGQ